MATEVVIKRVSFAAGEVSPFLQFRDDLARTQIAAARIENFFALLEGGLGRTPGTRFVTPLKDETKEGKLVPFRFTATDNYMLLFNSGVMRVLKDGGMLESSPGVPYELAVPWVNSNDMPKLRWQPDPDNSRMFIFCEGYQTQVLTRTGHTNWSIAPYLPEGGPVDPQNLDTTKTIQASAVTGNVTLTGVNTSFSAGDIGGVYRLDEANLTLVRTWQPDETILSPETPVALAVAIGDLTAHGGLAAAFDNNVVQTQIQSAGKLASNQGYIGQDFGGTPQMISRVLAVGSTDQGFIDWGAPTRITLYGKNTAPANATDGKLLGEVSFTNENDERAGRYIYSREPTVAYRYVWVAVSHDSAPSTLSMAELKFFKWTSVTPVNQRRYNGNVYLALNDGNTKQSPPTHLEGDVLYADIVWRFLHPGYGFVRITAVTSALLANGTVLDRLPDSVVTTPTYRWWPPAWSPGKGWPEVGILHDGRLFFARKNTWWLTRPSNRFSVEETPAVNNVPDPDSALSIRLASRGEGLPWIAWAYSGSVLLLGLRDNELIVRAPQQFDPLTVDKVRPVPATGEGSAPHYPAVVDDGLIFIGRSRKRLHFLKFENLPAAVAIDELTITHRRIVNGGATTLAWQRDPHRLLWVRSKDYKLAGLTFMPAQQVLAPFRRPFGTGNVVDVASIAQADEGAWEVYVIVQRIINGANRVYVEQMRPFFEPTDEANPTASGAWFVDSGLAYQGAAATTLSGLTHLIGQTVRVFAEGSKQADKVVSATGAITLDWPVTQAVVGLPLKAVFRSLPFEVEGSKGKRKGAHHILVDVIESAGGRARMIAYDDSGVIDGGQWTELLATGDRPYDGALPLYSGTVRVSIESISALRIAVEIEADHAAPFTLAGVSPDVGMEGG